MNRPSLWDRLIFAIWPPLPVWWRLDASCFVVVLYTSALCWLYNYFHFSTPDWGTAAAGLNAIILGLLLGFRNAQSYDRWWEGRKLWGQLVNDTRNLCLKVDALANVTPADRDAIKDLAHEFPEALLTHLRIPTVDHRPMAIAGQAMKLVQGWKSAGRIDDFDRYLLDPHLRAFMDVCGACERIKGTPVPLSYRSLLRHGLVILLLVTPLFIVEKSGWLSVLAMGMLSYFLLGIELTAESIENPFEGDFDDLPLEKYVESVQKSVARTREAASTPLS
jgi:putative membrane protein